MAKRLPCVVAILPGEVDHPGKHLHSRDKIAFHYCEMKYDLSLSYKPLVSADRPWQVRELRIHLHATPGYVVQYQPPYVINHLLHGIGHPQREHETSHGSMSKTQWTVDGPDGTVVELDGRKFGSNDSGAPMLV